MGVSTASQHHHRSTTKSDHRPFKSRHATKGVLKDLAKGKVEKSFGAHAKSRHQQVISKIDRRHQARQQRVTKNRDHLQNTSIFQGQKGAPRIVAVVPLSEDVDSVAAVQKLNNSIDVEVDVNQEVPTLVEIERFKQKLQYVPVSGELFNALNACRTADFVLFVLSAREEVGPKGELMLKSIESQGVSSVLTCVYGLDAIEPAKRRPQITASLKSFITHYFPSQEKVHSLDSPQECTNALRSICTATPKGIRWREERSWLLSDEARWIDGQESGAGSGTLVLRGTIRGKNLNANRLLQIGDYGSYQIERIVEAPALRSRKRKVDEMGNDDELRTLQEPDVDQDDLKDLAPEEIVMEDTDSMAVGGELESKGVLLDDHHYFSDDEPQATSTARRLPKGTSDYQAAWYLEDVSDSGSDMESVMDADTETNTIAEKPRPEDGLEGIETATVGGMTEGAQSEYPQSEMFMDRSLEEEADELAAFRRNKRTEAEEDLEFPDEIELHPNVLARERLARYRGLKSLRTSVWDTSADKAHEPEDWNRLLQVPDYRGAKSRAMREILVGGVAPGTRVDIYVRNVPSDLKKSILSTKTLTAVALLRHENKRVVANYSITLNSDLEGPIKSKEELLVQCGSRRFVVNPLFSGVGNTPNNVHKFDRFLHPGRSCVATFVCPHTWGAVPVLFFKRVHSVGDESSIELIGTGTSEAPDQTRVIAKRVILTGHPFKIHKKLVTVRYMFFNKQDVRWFKALPLWTRRGRSGFIKESLGTHGYFKATFDAKINPQDSIGVSLYKRVFPRSAQPWIPSREAPPRLVNMSMAADEMEE